jgi:hypothetical protein
MNAHVRWLLTHDGQDPNQHAQPFGIHERLPLGPMPFEQWKTDGVEKLAKIPTRVTDPLAGKLASGAGASHEALLSPKDSLLLPPLARLVKFRDPSIKWE